MQTVSLVITHTQHQRLQLFRKALGRGVWPAPLGHSAYMSSHSHLKYITCCCVKKFKTSIPLHYSDLSACIHTTKSISWFTYTRCFIQHVPVTKKTVWTTISHENPQDARDFYDTWLMLKFPIVGIVMIPEIIHLETSWLNHSCGDYGARLSQIFR